MKGKRIIWLLWSKSDITEANITQKEMSNCMENHNTCIWDRAGNTVKEYCHYTVSQSNYCVYQEKNSHAHKLFYKVIKFSRTSFIHI